jgi:SRSO17 transposase
MDDLFDAEAQRRLGEFFSEIGGVLDDKGSCGKRRQASFAIYAMGLLSSAERKSAEPIAALACPEPAGVDRQHQRLIHFLADSPWSDRSVRRVAARYAVSALTAQEAIEASIIDDTGFLKQGHHSVGVQRQYTGTAGKITNCQIGVSLSLATRSQHVPIDFELYLPECWANDPVQRRRARIPDNIVFKTKPELAIDMLERAIQDGFPLGVLLADSAYGNDSYFRSELRRLGLDYAVGVKCDTNVWRVDRLLRRRGDPISVKELASQAGPKAFRRVSWRSATKKTLWSRFYMARVVPCHNDGIDPSHREDVWLICEWPPDEAEPTDWFFSTLSPRIAKRRLVRILKERWRTERVYEDLKGELGLDHFEGRRFPGWHHHITVALCCYAFVIAERTRRFPPSPRREVADDSLPLAA